MYQQITLVGNIGSDPVMRFTPKGEAVTNFDVATNDFRDGKEDGTNWFRVTAWGNLGERCNEYLAKGRKVMVVGRMKGEKGKPRVYQKKDGTWDANFEVTASDVRFIDSRTEASNEAVDEAGIPF